MMQERTKSVESKEKPKESLTQTIRKKQQGLSSEKMAVAAVSINKVKEAAVEKSSRLQSILGKVPEAR